MNFDEFWSSYTHPANRGDKQNAELRFNRIVKARQLSALQSALAAYRTYQYSNRWYHPRMLASWLGSAKNEPWRGFLMEAPKTVAPLIEKAESEEYIQQRAAGIQSQQKRWLREWGENKAQHVHGTECQHGSVCRYVDEKMPKVRELTEIENQIRAESV